MKEKQRYEDGLIVALKLLAFLQPHCERIEIAGSIRRRCPMVGDIELVAIPKKRYKPTLFGDIEDDQTLLDIHLEQNPKIYAQVRSGHRLKELRFQNFQVDLFLTDPDRWGVTFTLRTGSADFSKWLVTSRNQGGARRLDRYVKNSRIWQIGQQDPIKTPEEIDVFHALGVPWVPVEQRSKGYWGEDMLIWTPEKVTSYV